MARVGTRRIAPAAGPSVFARIWKGWEKIGSILAILGLADIFGQTVKWAAGIHWVVSRYALAREWLFSWVPFRIPEEWHDPIVLLLVLFSVTNIGYYRHTGRTYTGQLLWFLGYMVWAVVSLPLAWIPSIKKKRNQLSKDLNYRQIYASDKIANGAAIAIFGLAMTIAFLNPMLQLPQHFRDYHPFIREAADYLGSMPELKTWFDRVGFASQFLMLAMFSGALLAWRWILGTALVFAALVAINEVYVRWLEPFANG